MALRPVSESVGIQGAERTGSVMLGAVQKESTARYHTQPGWTLPTWSTGTAGQSLPWLTVMFTTAGAALAAASAMKWGPRKPGGGVAGRDSPPDKMLGVCSAGMEWA